MEGKEEHKQKISGPLVMVRRFYALAEAMVAQSILDSAGIDALLTDEGIVQMVYPNLVGGLKLMVRPEDLETAVQLLSQMETGEIELQEEPALDELLRKASQRKPSGGEGK